jgi:hypothetical protein
MKKLFVVLILVLLYFSNLFSVYHKAGGYFSIDAVRIVEVQDNIAYVLDVEEGLLLIDISDPANTVLLGSYQNINSPWDLAVSDEIVCVTSHDLLLYIIDVSDPTEPVLLSSISTPDYWGYILLIDSMIYVTCDGELQIFDIRDPANPNLLGIYDLNSPLYDIAVSNNIAYITSFYDVLKIIDVSNPFEPVLLSSFNTHGDAYGVEVSNELVFLTDDEVGLLIIDVSDPQFPNLLSCYHSNKTFYDVVVQDTLAYVINPYYGFQAISFSDPMNPELLSEYDTPGYAKDFNLQNNCIYIADDSAGLQIIDVLDHTNTNMVSWLPSYSDVLEISNDLLVSSGGGLQTYDISDPWNPTILGINYGAFQEDLEISGSLVYGAHYSNYSNSSLQIIDVSIPESPTVIGFCSLTTNVYDLAHHGNKVYLAAAGEGLHIVDVSDPTRPLWESSYNTPYWALNVDYANMKAYVADGFSGLQIIDVSNPGNPTYSGCYNNIIYAKSVVAYDSLVFVTDDDSVIHIVDVSSASNPVLLSTIHPHEDSEIDCEPLILNGHLIIADKAWNEILSYNISNPSNPELVNSYLWNYPTTTIAENGEYLICGNQYNFSIHLLECITNSDEIMILKNEYNINNYPNPFNPSTTISFNLPEEGKVKLEIYNIKGQKVRAFNLFPNGSLGTREVIWNGTDENNQPVSSGIYFYELNVSGKTEAVKKCLLLK